MIGEVKPTRDDILSCEKPKLSEEETIHALQVELNHYGVSLICRAYFFCPKNLKRPPATEFSSEQQGRFSFGKILPFQAKIPLQGCRKIQPQEDKKMAKKFYVLDEQGSIKSSDGKKRYTLLCGKKLYDFLQSPQGKRRKFTIEEDDNGDEIGVEIPEYLIPEYKREENRKEYLSHWQEESGITLVSYDAIDINGEEVSGDEIICDETAVSAEELLIEKEDRQRLTDAIRSLTKEELYILKGLFFENPRKTETSLGKELGMTHQAIHKKKEKIFEKIKNFLK